MMAMTAGRGTENDVLRGGVDAMCSSRSGRRHPRRRLQSRPAGWGNRKRPVRVANRLRHDQRVLLSNTSANSTEVDVITDFSWWPATRTRSCCPVSRPSPSWSSRTPRSMLRGHPDLLPRWGAHRLRPQRRRQRGQRRWRANLVLGATADDFLSKITPISSCRTRTWPRI